MTHFEKKILLQWIMMHDTLIKSRNFREQKLSQAKTFANINFRESKKLWKVYAHEI